MEVKDENGGWCMVFGVMVGCVVFSFLVWCVVV